MGEGSKTLTAVLVALLLAVGLVACGGDDSDSGAGTDGATQAQSDDRGSAGGNGGKQASGKSGDDSSRGGTDGSGGEAAKDFEPKPHDDSGGGSAQFRVKGGDNSVQEFGEEADRTEFDAAARALHNFLDARAEGQWAAACDYLSADIVESLEKLAAQARKADSSQEIAANCAGILGKLTNPAAKGALLKEAKRADVGSLRIEGDRAFVIYRGLDGTIMAMAMTQEDDRWKVGSLAGTPLN